MINLKIYLLWICFLFFSNTFYVSKYSIPTIFTNQLTTFNISHNGGALIQFQSDYQNEEINLQKNGTLTLLIKNQGCYQMKIKAINSFTSQVLYSFQYFFTVINQQKQYQKTLWIIDQSNYYQRTTERPLTVQTDQFDYHAPIYINENIFLKLKCKNAIGKITWMFQGLPQTMNGNKNTGAVNGYAQKVGSIIIRCIAVDSVFRIGQIYIYLNFRQYAPTVNLLGETTYRQYDPLRPTIEKQRTQNAGLLQNQIKNALNKRQTLISQRLQKISNYRNITLFKQQLVLDEQVLSQQIIQKSKSSDQNLKKITQISKQLQSNKNYLSQLKSILSDKQSHYSIKLDENQNLKSIRGVNVNQSQQIKKDFDMVKKQIEYLQNNIYQIQTNTKQSEFQRARQNVTYVQMQKQQVRTRQILEIRKNIQFQYLIKKAQTDNKVRRYQDYAFLAQSNYDSAFSRYKDSVRQYIQLSIKSKNLQSLINQALQQYNAMKKYVSSLKLNYSISLGNFQTLNTAKEQLNRLTNYLLNNATNSTSSANNISSNTNLNKTLLIDIQTKKQAQEYPFTGCKKIGNFQWAGSGKIKFIGQNSLILTSQQTLNFGKCTVINNKLNKQLRLNQDQWIQYTGYYWDGAIQAYSITIIS